MDEACAVCQDELESDTAGSHTHTLTCGHRFHTTCVLSWFRRGAQTCPSCRDVGLPAEESPIGALALHARASTLRRYARRKTAPKALVDLAQRVRRSELSLAGAKRAIRAHRLTHKAVFALDRLLNEREFKQHCARSFDLRALGMYEGGELRLPTLFVNTHNPDDVRGGRSWY